jgi:AcrR family transcriptional regulator
MENETRKTPKQKRSISMLSDILSGTQKALDNFGIDKISTSKIAQTTGISVGSFYQYFKNKDFALINLSKKISESVIKKLTQKIESSSELPLLQRMEILTSFYIDQMFQFSDYMSFMPKMIWKLEQSSFFISNRNLIATKVATILEESTKKTHKDCLDFSWLMINMINGTLHHSFQSSDSSYDKEKLRAFLLKLVDDEINQFIGNHNPT